MKPFWIVPLFAGAMLAAAPTMAQNSSGTPPDDKGLTGWSGGNRGPTGSGNAEAAKDQPFMASGIDLKGPPQQFPPGQTPE